MKTSYSKITVAAIGSALALGGVAANAGDGNTPVNAKADMIETETESSFCDVFKLAEFYKGEGFINSVAFSGRLQFDGAFFYPEQGSDYEDAEFRRVRAGFKVKFLEDFVAHAEADFDFNNFDPTYNALTDAYLGWSPSESFELKVGKISAGFTSDGKTSSKKLLRAERGNLTNNVWYPLEYFSGVAANGEVGNWFYNVGGFSSAFGPEFGDFDSGIFGLVTIGYDMSEEIGFDKASVAVDYVYNDRDENSVTGRDIAQVVSLNGEFGKGDIGITFDVAGAEGYREQPDLFGAAITPYYNINESWQFVTSYNYVNSDGDNGVRLNRYESRAVSGTADEVHEFYTGFNWYICGHNLKWQNGVSYTTASDNANDGGSYDGWGFTSALRLSW